MNYKPCKVELTDELSRYEIRATSFNYIPKERKKGDYNRAKDEREFWKEER